MGCIAAALAGEHGLASTIGFGAMPTHVAGLAGVSGIDQNHWHTLHARFVLDEGPQLVKAPAMYRSSLGLPKPGPVAYAGQLFQGNTTFGVFGCLDELLGKDVVGISAEPMFALMHPAQGLPDLLGSLAAFGSSTGGFLQALTSHVVPLACPLDLLPTHAGAIASRGKIDDAEIDAKEVGGRPRRCLREIDDDKQKPRAITPQYEETLPMRCRKALPLVGTHNKRHQHTPVQRQQTDMIDALEAHEALIVRHGRMRAKGRADALVVFVGAHDSGNTAHRHLWH